MGSLNLNQNKSTSILSILACVVVAGGCGKAQVALPEDPKFTSLTVSCAYPSAPKSVNFPCTSTGFMSDGSTVDLSDKVDWSVADGRVLNLLSVEERSFYRGWMKGLTPGTTKVTATYGTLQGSAYVDITPAVPASLSVLPTGRVHVVGNEVQYSVICNFSDNTAFDVTGSAVWSTSSAAIAEISNAAGKMGLLHAKAVGSGSVTANFSGLTGTASFAVLAGSPSLISVYPITTNLVKGLDLQFSVRGVYPDLSTVDLTNSVSWSVSDGTVASVDNSAGARGLVHGLGVGTTQVRATIDGLAAVSTVTVVDPHLDSITFAPSSLSLATGLTRSIMAMASYSDGTIIDVSSAAAWSSDDTAIASVGTTAGHYGEVTALSAGSTSVRAVLNGVTALAAVGVSIPALQSIVLNPSTGSVAKGLARQFTATGIYSDASQVDVTNFVSWNSSNTGIATISNAGGTNGRLQSVNMGSATVTAVLSGVTAATSITVTAATLSSLAISPSNPSVAKGFSQQFVATGTYTDGTSLDLTSLVSWSSFDSALATIQNSGAQKGLAQTVNVGSVAISASLASTSSSATLTVTSPVLLSVSLSPASVSLAKGLSQAIVATGTYSDGSTADISSSATWSSADPTIISVSNTAGTKGVLTAQSLGSTSVSMILSGVTSSLSVTGTPAVLASIAVTPANPTVAKGLTQQFIATGTYTDGTTADLTSSVTWASSATALATIQNGGSKGLATAVAVGTSTISATFSGVTGSTLMTVSAATLQSIALSPSSLSIAKGLSQSIVATGSYSDGSTADVTLAGNWTSSDALVATVGNAGGAKGSVTGTGIGSATVTVTIGSVSQSLTVATTAATVQSIAVTPGNASVLLLAHVWYTATATYSDGSTANITTSVTWTSSNTLTATIRNDAGHEGDAKGLGVGGTTIRATLGGVYGEATLSGTL